MDFIRFLLGKTNWMKTFVGLAFLCIFGTQALWILQWEIPAGNREIAHFMFGEVAGVVLTIASYYFGSSKGSQEKTEIIKQQSQDKTDIIKQQNEKLNP